MVAVHGDGEHPFSHGYTCPKGRALPQIHHHPDRLERPQMRVDGTLQDTTWEACLDDLGAKLRETIERHGPESVGINFGTGVGMDAVGYRIAQSLHAAIGTPAKFSPLTIDGTAKVLMADLMGGSSALTGRPDFDNAGFAMFIGSNPVVSHGHTVGLPNPRGAIRDLAKHAEVWVVDPRYTETARLATHHLAPRPGTDYAVLAYLVREVLRDGVKVPAQDVDALAAAVAPFTLQHASTIADVPEAELERLLSAVRRAGRIVVDTGTGVTMSASANVTQWLSWALLIITESMNRPGGIWFHPGFAYQFESFELPISPPEGQFRTRSAQSPGDAGVPAGVAVRRAARRDQRGQNPRVPEPRREPAHRVPQHRVAAAGAGKLDVLATTEILPNETTAISTHVLPTKGQLERPDVTLWDILSPRVSAQHTDAVVAPVGQRRSMWWVLAEIGRRLGHELADSIATDEAMLAQVSSGGRAPYDELVANGWAEADRELPAPWVDWHIERLGGRRLAPRVLVDQLHALREPAPLVLVPRRQMRRLNAQLEFLGEAAEIVVHPDDAAAAGVSDYQRLIVRSEHGELTGVARVDASVRRGAVSVPHGHAGANVNLLTSKDDIDPVTGMTRYSGVPVSLHPA